QPLEVDFNDATDPPLTNLEWTFAGNSMPIADPNSIHTFHSSGVFGLTMTGTSANGCLVSRAFENEITVYPKPTADFSPSSSQTGLYNAFIEFTDRSDAGVTDWYWEFTDGASSVEQNPTHLFSDTGLFMVTLEVTNAFNCLDTAIHPVEITPEFSFWIPNAFTPDNDSLNNFFSGEGMGINWDEYQMQIFNRWGMLIYSTSDIKKPWDGTYKGKPAEVAGYSYHIRLEEVSGFKRRYTGYFTLVR
ncbi:MAG: gliding motility-associated-like protein, partial [Oceanospirillaceae bacterium]